MNSVQDIEQAIEKLPKEEYARLVEWFERRLAEEAREAEEDRDDVEAARASQAELGENIPWEKIKAESFCS